MKRSIFMFALCALLLCGCANSDGSKQTIVTADTISESIDESIPSAADTDPIDTHVNDESASDPESPQIPETDDIETDDAETNGSQLPETDPAIAEDSFVSPLAEEKYLTPFEEYSWEKEFDTEYVMIHFTSNVVNNRTSPYNVEDVYEIFKETKVSAHYVIDRDGKIYCLIPENYSAWHAGAGVFANDEKYTNKMNKYSIGIELLAIGSEKDMETYLTSEEYNALDKSLIGYTDEQYASLKLLLMDICERNSIEYSREHIIGHSEFNEKKNDPGELFMWDKLFQ